MEMGVKILPISPQIEDANIIWDTLEEPSLAQVEGDVQSEESILSDNIVWDDQVGLPGVPSQEFAPPSELAEEEGRPFPVGATIGGTIGAAVGGIPGAGLGAGAGEATEQLARRGARALGVEGVRGIPETSEEAAEQIRTEAKLGIIGEGIGRGVVSIGTRVLSSASKTVTPEARRAISFLSDEAELLKAKGIKGTGALRLSPAEATENRALDILQNAADKSLIGGGSLTRFKKQRVGVLADVADDLIESFGPRIGPDEAGEFFLDVVEGKIKASKALVTALQNTSEELYTRGGGGDISVKGAKSFVAPLVKALEEAPSIDPALGGDALLKSINKWPTRQIVTPEGLLEQRTAISFSRARDIRSQLLSYIRKGEISGEKAPAIGKARKLVGIIDTSMEESLKKTNPQALDAWRLANEYRSKRAKDFDSKFIRQLVRAADAGGTGTPEAMSKRVFRPGNIAGIRKLKTALKGDDVAWKKMQSFYVQDVFSQSTSKSGTNAGEIIGSKLKNNLANMSKNKSLTEIMGTENATRLREFANALDVIQAKQGEGIGGMFIQLSQAGAIVSIPVKGKVERSAVAILLAPGILAKLFTNPTAAKVMIEGIKAGPKSQAISGLSGRFLTDVVNMQFLEEGRKRKERVVEKRPLPAFGSGGAFRATTISNLTGQP